jgi:hypothetical protein
MWEPRSRQANGLLGSAAHVVVVVLKVAADIAGEALVNLGSSDADLLAGASNEPLMLESDLDGRPGSHFVA